MQLQESGEMYLETILILKNKFAQVRAIDIVNYTGYTKPSVSRAIGLLKGGKFIQVDSDGYIAFTDSGEALAFKIYERHKLLTSLFVTLGVDEKVASEDACKIEHHISDETFEAIKKHIKGIR
ncbi:MAG: metal-dependent transcriptional regulator [Clostridium sp.]|uniref:metal-dependent transcriptional regulator n=1 Tax=Clostridium sp. TaxID=1506 RepID=UPI003D6C847F